MAASDEKNGQTLIDVKIGHFRPSFLSRTTAFAIILAAFLYWPKISALWAPIPATFAVPSPAAIPPNLSSRHWTNRDNRSFEGSFVAADNQSVIIRRSSDSVLFKVDLKALSDSDQTFTHEQITRAKKLGLQLESSIHVILRKLEIKGSLEKIATSQAEGGYRMSRIDPMYWLLLSPPLNEGEPSARWIRIDEKAFRLSEENTLVSNENLTRFLDGKGGFSESLLWPRPEFTIIEARYGGNHKSPNLGAAVLENPNAGADNVTHLIMRFVSEGKLPLETCPSVMLPHQGNELSVLWRTPSGEVRQSLRDGSLLTWP